MSIIEIASTLFVAWIAFIVARTTANGVVALDSKIKDATYYHGNGESILSLWVIIYLILMACVITYRYWG